MRSSMVRCRRLTFNVILFILLVLTLCLLQYSYLSLLLTTKPISLPERFETPSPLTKVDIHTVIRENTPCFDSLYETYDNQFLYPNCWTRLAELRHANKNPLPDEVLCAFEPIRPRPVVRPKTFVVLVVGVHRGPAGNEQHMLPCAGFELVNWITHYKQHPLELRDIFLERYTAELLAKAQRLMWEHYREDADLLRADAILCGFDTWHCLMFAPFNKKLIFNPMYRYEGHHMPERVDTKDLQRTLDDVMRYNSDVIMAGGSVYDVMYTQHYLGTHKIIPLLADCEYVQTRLRQELEKDKCPQVHNDTSGYHPSRREVSIFPKRLSPGGRKLAHVIMNDLKLRGTTYKISLSSSIEGFYNYCDLGIYKAAIMLPYSIMSYFCCETANLGIPMLMPSPRLLADWQKQYHVVQERKGVLAQRDIQYLRQSGRSLNYGTNPNADFHDRSLERWLGYAEMYYNGADTFDTLDELYERIEAGDFERSNVRLMLQRANNFVRQRMHWQAVYRYFFADGTSGDRDIRMPTTFEQGMEIWRKKNKRPIYARLIDENVRFQRAEDQRPWVVLVWNTTKSKPRCDDKYDEKVVLFDFHANSLVRSEYTGCKVLTTNEVRRGHERMNLLVNEVDERYPNWKEMEHIKRLLMTIYAISKGATSVTVLSRRRNDNCRLSNRHTSLVDEEGWMPTSYDKTTYWMAWLPVNEQIARVWVESMLRFKESEPNGSLADVRCLNSFPSVHLQFSQLEIDYFQDYMKHWRTDEELAFSHVLDQNIFELAVKGYASSADAKMYRFYLEICAQVGLSWYTRPYVDVI